MRIVVDGLPIRSTSLAVVVEHLLAGWQHLEEHDDIHVVVGHDAAMTLPPTVTVHRVRFGRAPTLSRLQAQNHFLPGLCRTLAADVLLAPLPTTTVRRLPCPRALIAHDLRHELRPDQFATGALLLRRLGYGIGFRQADAVICVSERTRGDLLRSRPWLRGAVVRVALHGADHVLAWGDPPPLDPDGEAIAFGQYENKNVELVVDAWSVLREREVTVPLVIVGLPDHRRASVDARVRGLGLQDRVQTLPWLSSDAFRQRFLSARMVVFPSDFEGFGLPAVEAMRIGVPLVISEDPALVEVTGGHAMVAKGSGPAALADAVTAAAALGPKAIEAARVHAARFTWKQSARAVRDTLREVAR